LELQGWTIYSAKLSDCLLAELVAEVQQVGNLSDCLLAELVAEVQQTANLSDCLLAEVGGVEKAAAGLPRVDGPV
jgi:hypothetical protein